MSKPTLISSRSVATPTRYFRVRSPANARFVEFDFAIGDPSLFVELVMPPAAFESFCRSNEVVQMTTEQEALVDAELSKWRYGEDTLMSDNHDRSTALTDNNKQQD